MDEAETSPVMLNLWAAYQKKFSYASDLDWNTVMAAVRQLFARCEGTVWKNVDTTVKFWFLYRRGNWDRVNWCGLWWAGRLSKNLLGNRKALNLEAQSWKFWCRRWDLNPHVVAHNRFWVCLVCHSDTPACFAFASVINFIILKIKLQAKTWGENTCIFSRISIE